jgi:hypothetical protein
MLEWLQGWLPVLKDAVTAGVALGGLRIAWLGVDAWKRQLRGQTEYDLARRLLRATLDVRDAVARLRSPMVWAAEMQKAAADAGYDSPTDYRAEIEDREPYILALLARLREVSQYTSAFEVEALEAEVVFGQPARAAADQLHRAARAALIAVQMHANDERAGPIRKPEAVQAVNERLMKAFAGLPEDKIAADLATAVRAIESVARPHLTDRGGGKP